MRIVFVNRFYWPEEPATAQLLADLAEGLAAAGWSVTVLASHPGTADLPGSEVRKGVRIVRLRGPRLGRKSLVGRLVEFAVFTLGSAVWLAAHVGAGSIVVAKTDPPMLGTWLWPVVLAKRALLVHWTQDIYPEVALAMGGSPIVRGLVGLLRMPRNVSWRAASACVTPGEDMAGAIMREGVPRERIAAIANWAPAGVAPASLVDIAAWRTSWGLEGRFVVMYSGNLGRVHDLEPLLRIAALLRDSPEIALVFVGDGAQRARLESIARSRQLDNVRFLPAQQRDRLSVSLSAGDLHAVTLREACAGTVFPSKIYGVAAVGRPVLFIGPSGCSPAAEVTNRGFGLCFQRDDATGAARAVRTLAADDAMRKSLEAAALHFGRMHGSPARAVSEWDSLLRRIADLKAARADGQA